MYYIITPKAGTIIHSSMVEELDSLLTTEASNREVTESWENDTLIRVQITPHTIEYRHIKSGKIYTISKKNSYLLPKYFNLVRKKTIKEQLTKRGVPDVYNNDQEAWRRIQRAVYSNVSEIEPRRDRPDNTQSLFRNLNNTINTLRDLYDTPRGIASSSEPDTIRRINSSAWFNESLPLYPTSSERDSRRRIRREPPPDFDRELTQSLPQRNDPSLQDPRRPIIRYSDFGELSRSTTSESDRTPRFIVGGV